MADALIREAKGILAWIVEGWMAYQERGLGIPDGILAATDEYRRENDCTFRFLQECTAQGGFCRLSLLRERFMCWCGANGVEYLSDRELSRYLVNRGYQRYTNDGTCFRGLTLIEEDE